MKGSSNGGGLAPSGPFYLICSLRSTPMNKDFLLLCLIDLINYLRVDMFASVDSSLSEVLRSVEDELDEELECRLLNELTRVKPRS